MKEIILKLKEEFVNAHIDYKNDVDNFVNYLEKQVEGASFYNYFTLGGMSAEGILRSLDYYVECGQFRSKETARKYLSAVGQLFEYILENTDIKNSDLRNQLGAPASRSESYLRLCNEHINSHPLLFEKEKNSALTDEEAKELLDICNVCINQMMTGDVEGSYNVALKRMVISMCIKLMLFLGIAYRQVRTLKFSDVDFKCGTINVNGYLIRLPLGYTKQIQEYRRILEQNGYNVSDGHLFITIDGEQWGEKTTSSGIPDFLRGKLQQTSITSIIKYGITKLLIAGMSDNVVIGLTGVSREILQDCIKPEDDDTYNYVNEMLLRIPLYMKF